MELDAPGTEDPNEPFVNEDEMDGLDLTPRQAPAVGGAASPTRVRKVAMGGVLAVILLALGMVAWQGLSNATLYFRNADEAVAQRESLGESRFRLQGTVVEGSITTATTDEGIRTVTFAVQHNDVVVDVHHVGDPPEMFQPGVPAVLEGRWSAVGDHFDSDRVLIKHSETYEEDNPGRTDDYVGRTGEDADAAEPDDE